MKEMGGTFKEATSFNQDLSCWDVSSVTWFHSTFKNSAMDRKLCWVVSGTSTTTNMFSGTTGSVDATCTAACAAEGEACSTDSECISGSCDGTCQPPPPPTVGNACTSDADCNEKCINSVCTLVWKPADRDALRAVINDCVAGGSYNSNTKDYEGGGDGSECYACADGTPKTSSTASCDDGSTPQFISDWDVSQVTDFSSLFSSKHQFNQPLANWETSQVTNMYKVFNLATDFNQPLNSWDVSSVTNMGYVFINL